MLRVDKQLILIWLSGCLHNVLSQPCVVEVCSDIWSEGTKGSVKLLFSILADNKFKAIRSLGMQIAAWRHQLIWGGKFWVCSDQEASCWCRNASRPPCSSDSIDSALPVNAHYNINPFGPVTLNTFTVIVTQRAGYAAILTLDVGLCAGTLLHTALMLVIEQVIGHGKDIIKKKTRGSGGVLISPWFI